MKYADLHVHTFYSDSTFSPGEVVSCAKDRAIAAVAVCDHDSVSGIEPSRVIGKQMDVEIIPGIELAVEKSDAEIHILGYFVNDSLDWFRGKLEELQKGRIERVHKMVAMLRKEHINIDAEDVFKIAGRGTVGRLHLALAIMKTGKVKSMRDIFEKYIGFNKTCYVANRNFSPQEAIDIILKAGGVPVVAHPGCMGSDEYIPELIGYGLRGIEVFHSDHGPAAVKKYTEIARQHNLIITGGSDCHGLGKGRVMMGQIRMPYTTVEELRKAAGDK